MLVERLYLLCIVPKKMLLFPYLTLLIRCLYNRDRVFFCYCVYGTETSNTVPFSQSLRMADFTEGDSTNFLRLYKFGAIYVSLRYFTE